MSAAVEKYQQRVEEVNSVLCVGIDPDLRLIPERYTRNTNPVGFFIHSIIEQTAASASAFKLNLAFFEGLGEEGPELLMQTMDYLHSHYPKIFMIADAKRGDIDHVNRGSAKLVFDDLGFDAVTLSPYVGKNALMPFLMREDKASIIAVKTTDPKASEVQDAPVLPEDLDLTLAISTYVQSNSQGEGALDVEECFKDLVQSLTIPYWHYLTQRVVHWNENGNCMLVAAANHPAELKAIRKIVGEEMTLLIPGIGKQGGKIKNAVTAAQTSTGGGMIISSSRDIIYATNPRERAQEIRDEINSYRRS